MLHVRFEGRSLELTEACMGLRGTELRRFLHGRGGHRMGEAEVKRFVAQMLEVEEDRLSDHVVDESPEGNLIVRPAAIYG